MTHKPVHVLDGEAQLTVGLPPKIQPYLSQAEQFEMTNDKRGQQDYEETAKHTGPEQHLGDLRLYRPYRCRQRPPLPEQQYQHYTGRQYVSTALDSSGQNARQALLEGWARHY